MSDEIAFLIGDTSNVLRRSFDRRARQIGVNRSQWRLLLRLKRNPGVKQIQLAEYLDIEPIGLARMIDRLEQSGLVERRGNPNDRRVWHIHLTKEAEPVLARLQALSEEFLDDMLSNIGADDQDQLINTLKAIRENVRAADAEPVRQNADRRG